MIHTYHLVLLTMKCGKLRWIGYVARMGETKSLHGISVCVCVCVCVCVKDMDRITLIWTSGE